MLMKSICKCCLPEEELARMKQEVRDADSLNIMTRDPIVISDWLHAVRAAVCMHA
jgi:hypothetical protein